MPFHLETERLRLQPWTESDADELRVLHSERGTGTPTVERAREVIVKQLAATATSGIAYELLQRAHGRGYATEAAGAVLDAAIATGRKRLWPTVGTPNTSSFRVLEKLGFERDHVSADDHGEFVWLTRALP